MPKELERKLKAEAAQKGLTGRRADAYVYGTMAKRKKNQQQQDALRG